MVSVRVESRRERSVLLGVVAVGVQPVVRAQTACSRYASLSVRWGLAGERLGALGGTRGRASALHVCDVRVTAPAVRRGLRVVSVRVESRRERSVLLGAVAVTGSYTKGASRCQSLGGGRVFFRHVVFRQRHVHRASCCVSVLRSSEK